MTLANEQTSSDAIHDDVADYSGSPDSENPLGDAFNISLSLPESIRIRMVDASILEDYEIWVFLSSLSSSVLVGFVVACIQAYDTNSPDARALLAMSIFLGILFVAMAAMALKKRLILRRKGRDVKLYTSKAAISNQPRS